MSMCRHRFSDKPGDVCHEDAVGKSKYCRLHRQQAHKVWKARIKEDADAREARYATFAAVVAEAKAAAKEAYARVQEEKNLEGREVVIVDGLNGGREVGRIPDYFGWAWISVHPGNCSFARWAVKTGVGGSQYGGGVRLNPGAGSGFSSPDITAKEAGARAYAEVLREHKEELGIRSAYADSRLD